MNLRLFILLPCFAALSALPARGARVSFEPLKEPRTVAAVVKFTPVEKAQNPEKLAADNGAAKTEDKNSVTSSQTSPPITSPQPNQGKETEKSKEEPQAAQEEKPQGPAVKPAVLSIEGQVWDEPALRYVGKKLSYVVTVTWQGDLDLSAPEAPSLSGLQWVNSRTQDEIGGGAGQIKRKYLFELKALTEGPVQIGKVRIFYTDKASGKQNSIEAPAMDFDVKPAPRDYRPAALVIGIIIILIGAAAGIAIAFVLWRRRLAARQEVAPHEPTPLEKLRTGAEELDRMMIEGGGKEMFSVLARRMREFLTLTENVPMNNWTTDQISARLNVMEPPRADRGRVLDVLEKCDEVRYAAHQPTRDECESAMRDWKILLMDAIGTQGTQGTKGTPS
ncbi:MAG: hypothetical protein NTX50_10420 [Candidatus Sumerlaeota bacterium]|nr:hypothetical protein [Candidatus Sumerlaeota bacterium]